jgi:2-amino-4-hydroxy-6-hydroxymethyldihydropteridine diphosphokinase
VALARIGLGSNVGDAAANVERALEELGTLGRLRARSALYRTRPFGVTNQADFVNAAALLETDLEPRPLLAALKALEARLGRVATYRWGPRSIDLDILAYDDRQVDEPDLCIPHRGLPERAFALVPLAEIDPGFAAARDALPAAERAAVQRIRATAARRRSIVNWDEALERVRSAAEFCATAGLTRFRIDEERLAIEVRRSVRPSRQAAVPPADALPHQNGSRGASNGAASPPERARMILRAEFVGIVRLARPSVVAGSAVGANRELAYVESLGIRNPVRTGGAGRIADVFVTDGEAVEYGQPLFSIDV